MQMKEYTVEIAMTATTTLRSNVIMYRQLTVDSFRVGVCVYVGDVLVPGPLSSLDSRE